ncbi:HAD family hydrolase [Mesonia sp. K7]|uniref:KdsC family phosphatase n=1 Tax=Mesonia sp. K7 TaxID=2218606 RepID=UPI000DA8C5F5|nr:HAD-IIIA family hydrolase [Mesonia sp. K7]PZD79353.1 3-deoxy-D-manno-octulosonate 8-phosphate phosphatase [Mesonia sp. K7]
MEKNYKEILNDINTFVFDVDGVLTDGKVHIAYDGELLRSMNIKDGYALKKAVQKGYTICVISGGKNEAVRKRLRGLGITDIHLGIDDKVACLDEFFDVYNIDAQKVAYMGDDIPDVYPMKMVALPTCPQDAVPEVKAISKYISHKNGGQGCVRDLIEQVLKVQGNWIND